MTPRTRTWRLGRQAAGQQPIVPHKAPPNVQGRCGLAIVGPREASNDPRSCIKFAKQATPDMPSSGDGGARKQAARCQFSTSAAVGAGYSARPIAGRARSLRGAVEMDEQPGFVVEGERVALGPLRLDLVPTYQRWENDLEVANGNGRVMPFTLEAERDRVAGRSSKPDCLDFTVYDRADQTPIGWSTLAGIDHRNGTAEFGIHLGERRGQGLGTEATLLTLDWGFTMLGLHNIMLATAAWNQRAIRVYTKVGFREVGRRRSAGVTMGRRYDAVFMDLLASEFRQRGWSVLAGRTPQGGIQSLRRQRP